LDIHIVENGELALERQNTQPYLPARGGALRGGLARSTNELFRNGADRLVLFPERQPAYRIF
jgi:hypothetical protein